MVVGGRGEAYAYVSHCWSSLDLPSSLEPLCLPSNDIMDANYVQTSLTEVPSEILLQILGHLAVADLISLRQAGKQSPPLMNCDLTLILYDQTCKLFQEITHDNSLWIPIFNSYRESLPFASQGSPRSPEQRVLAARRINKLWLSARLENTIPQISAPRLFPLLGMSLFIDRWLLVVYGNGTANLWDTHLTSLHGIKPSATLVLDGDFHSYHASILPGEKEIMLVLVDGCVSYPYSVSSWALTKAVYSSHDVLTYSALLHPFSEFQLMHAFRTAQVLLIRDVDSIRGLYAFSLASRIRVEEYANGELQHYDIEAPETDDVEELVCT